MTKLAIATTLIIALSTTGITKIFADDIPNIIDHQYCSKKQNIAIKVIDVDQLMVITHGSNIPCPYQITLTSDEHGKYKIIADTPCSTSGYVSADGNTINIGWGADSFILPKTVYTTGQC